MQEAAVKDPANTASTKVFKSSKFQNFKLPEKECTIYKIKKEYADMLNKRKTSDVVMFSYFLVSCASLSLYEILRRYKLMNRTWAKWVVGLTIAHFAVVFLPIWVKIVRYRQIHEQTITELKLLECGTKYTIRNMQGEKYTYLISDCLFLSPDRVIELKKVTKNIKYRPEFPKKLNRYSFM